MWQNKRVQRKEKPSRDGRARVARCKTWRMVDDAPASEVKPRGDGEMDNKLTSFLPELGKVQLKSEPLSSPADMTNFSLLDPTNSEQTLDTSTYETKPAQAGESTMTPHMPQGRKRLRYKEPPAALASPESGAAHSHHDIPTRMTERITTPIEVTPEAIETSQALVPYSSSSSASEHIPTQKTDSAVEMGGKGNRKEQSHPLTEEDQELVFRGRSVNPSNATNDSWRWDPVIGALVSNTSGASYRPTIEKTKSDATVSVANTKLQDYKWAKKPSSKTTQPRRDWANSDQQKEPTSAAERNGWAAANENVGSWDTGHPPYPSKTHLDTDFKQQNKRQPRAPGRKPKESPWIKDSLIPKGDPNRHKVRWSSSTSESSSFSSNRASSGWGTRRRRDQNNDNGGELADWAGGLGPASIDWDSRSKFRDHQSVAKIESWLNNIELTPDDRSIPPTTQDVAPRYWFQAHLDGRTAKSFWAEHMAPGNIKPFDRDDLKGVKPWWENYADDDHSLLKELDHPEVVGMDPDESAEERRAREQDNGSGNAGESRKNAEKAKREAQRKRTLAKREQAHKFSGTHMNQASTSDPIKPGLSMFVRLATKEDMVQLRDIYNRYIDNAFVVPETDRLTETDMLERWQAIRNAELPFIVACQRGEVIKARNKKFGDDMVMPDRMIGFAYAADWSDGTCIYRLTVKLEVFVHMEQYMKHIGDCLTDKMMGLLDPQFVERGGYDVVGEDLERAESTRVISNVLIRYSYESDNKAKLVWVSDWLKRRFGFEQVADLQGVAQKFEKQ
jgi:L-amino acid N-acyltransferase YncA